MNGERRMPTEKINMYFQPIAQTLRLNKDMKQILFFFLLVGLTLPGRAQKIDCIFFHLYTDSLKKGTHNYINIDGKTSDGKWIPLTHKQIDFSTSYGKFEGTELVLPDTCLVEKLTVKAVLKSNPSLSKEIVIWIKKIPDPELLPTKEEVLKNKPQKNQRSRDK